MRSCGHASLLRSRRGALLLGACAALSACGFELRRAPELRFATIQLRGFAPASTFAEELRRQIATTPTTRVVETAGQAQVLLQAFTDARERVVVATTASGQVREIQLRARLIFKLSTPDEVELIPRTELLLDRDLSYDESAALGKEQEEEQLFRAMQADIAAQLMRRLAAVRLP